jgi:hypothetical protein
LDKAPWALGVFWRFETELFLTRFGDSNLFKKIMKLIRGFLVN